LRKNIIFEGSQFWENLKVSYFQGYVGDPARTAAYFDVDGFAEVGDVGYFEADGKIFIEGRINDLIRSPLLLSNFTVKY
jgi:acyl-CoA synthetase (AMP-forming)/AMP-acid ligase II